MKNLPDWAVRTLKTFVQAFFGTLLPETAIILNNGLPENISVAAAAFTPVIVSALSSAICAAWNIISEALNGKDV